MSRKKTRYLALETSSPQLSLALSDGARIKKTWTGKEHWRHAESLVQGIDKILARQKWTLQSLNGIAVSQGPGSFTGIRIGISAARTLGQFLKIPVVGISALEVVAYNVKAPVIAPVMDALQDHVYAGLYGWVRGRWKRLAPDMRCAKDAWNAACATWKKTYGSLTIVESGVQANHYPRADVLLALAQTALAKARTDSYKRVLPLYLREATAVERLNAPHRGSSLKLVRHAPK